MEKLKWKGKMENHILQRESMCIVSCILSCRKEKHSVIFKKCLKCREYTVMSQNNGAILRTCEVH